MNGIGKWEKIDNDTYRRKVFGGWIVMETADQYYIGNSDYNGDYNQQVSTTFVPDAKHEWKCEEVK